MKITYFPIKKRLLRVLFAAAFLLALLFFRLGYVVLIKGKDYQSRALEQWTRDLPLTAIRGDIVDANGKLLALSETSYTVYVRAKSITDASAVSSALSKILGVDASAVYKKATDKGVSETVIRRQVDCDSADKIRELNFDGVYIASDSTREYVYGDLLTQTLGYVSVDNEGQTGIEQYYNKYLEGIDGMILTQSDLIGRELENYPIYYVPQVKGLTVQLTIDVNIQLAADSVMELAHKAHNAKRAACIVMDVTNGEILALSIKPSVDLNNLPRDDMDTLLFGTNNVLFTEIYEPGSTFKLLTVSANIEEHFLGNKKAFSPTYVFANNASYRIIDGGSKINCWTNHNNGKHHNQTLSLALNHSCNPIFTDVALSLGKETFYKYLKAFGYGSVTGVDFLGEQAGIVIGESSVTTGDLARIGFGQSIAVTAIQLANATAAAVNGGYLYEPKLVKAVLDSNGDTVISYPTKVINRPISERTSRVVMNMMEEVVTNGGGKNAYIEGYRVGGKTGTAQKFVNGQISVGKNVSSFVGVFPSNSPKYLALVIVDEPIGVSYGSVVAAPYAKMIFEQIIYYKQIAPIKKEPIDNLG
ncbi:MAG: penicillin-binding transpeptidase domain-containing protein [Clostridia bacterium]|nr:penicillin-binding transpeptidase domain-containing protein [Clostridia bacterium]